ncbi:MAG: phosphoribosylformylglycinamidine synthase subunit PurL [Nitrososphaerales archaeon]
MEREKKLRLNLTEEEVESLRKALGREPNDLELAMIDAEWSEHCSYKSSKPLLKLLPTQGKHVILGPGYDAGVLDIGDGYVLTAHIESHNHPSAIDPYGGAATGVGGILRDIICMGTRPIALLDVLRFGSISVSSHSRWLFKHVVRGISDYGNCVGVPTVGGEVEFDETFERNCLVDVVCFGVGKKSDLVLAEARHVGDSIILIGGLTGRDGLHGSSFASAVLTESSEQDRSAVQIPDPFAEKMIMEATLESIGTGRVRGLKDLGGGGLSCGLSEIADKGGTGVEIELTRVPLSEEDMHPIEIMISESQERMLLVVEGGYEEEVAKIFRKYGVRYSIIGKVTDDKHVTVKKAGTVLTKIRAELLANAPIIYRRAEKPKNIESLANTPRPDEPHDLEKTLLQLLSLPNIASKQWIYEQYDHEVGLKTVIKPGQAGAAVLRLPNNKFIAVRADGNSKHCYLDPYHGAAGVFAEACRNVLAVGAKPIAMLDHLQFGDPSNPEVFWAFSESVKGIADYAKNLNIPCIGGKVSFYNEDKVSGKAIKPTPVVAVIGLADAVETLKSNRLRVGSRILILGETKPELGGSEYYEGIHGLVGGKVPKVDFEYEKRLHRCVLKIVSLGLAKSLEDLSKGGLATALAELSIKSGVGMKIDLNKVPNTCERLDEILFSETHGRFVAEANVGAEDRIKRIAASFNIPCEIIGEVEGEYLSFEKGVKKIKVQLRELEDTWRCTIPKLMGDEC